MTYRIVGIKRPAHADWLTPRPSDLVQITGPVATTAVCDGGGGGGGGAAAEGNDEGFGIPCAAHLSWGDRSVHLECLYHSPAALFTVAGKCADETADAADGADRVDSVGITMQDAIVVSGGGEGDEGVEDDDDDVRDDNGNPFMVLHVNRGLGGSARLYCKKVPQSRIGLTAGSGESLAVGKERRRTGR